MERQLEVSVIMPCYNEPLDIFKKSLESVLEQTLSNIEIIIILDDPNNHALKGVIEEYKKSCENIVFLEPKENLGRGIVRNLAISHSRGEFIAIHDSDDIDMPNRLETQLTYMRNNPDISAVIFQTLFVNKAGEESKYQPKWLIDKKSFFEKPYNHQTFFAKKETLEKYGPYKDKNFGEDFDLWLRMYLGGEKIGYGNEILTHYLSPDESLYNDYNEKISAWLVGNIQLRLRYFFHEKMFFDIHNHKMLLKEISKLLIQKSSPELYRSTRANIKKVLCNIKEKLS